MSMSTGCLLLEGDCTIGRMRELHALVGETADRPGPLALDAGGVTHSDITFVQLVVSASKTLEARGHCVSVVRPSDGVKATFERAGLGIDRDTGRVSVLEG